MTFVAIDTETTGRKPENGGRIIQIGAIPFDMSRAYQDDGLSEFVDPLMDIPYLGATSVHGITNGMVRGKPKIEEVLPHLWKLVGQRPAVIHNAAYDMQYLAFESERVGCQMIPMIVIDTMVLARKIIPGLSRYGIVQVAEHLKLDHLTAKHHDALADALMVAKVFPRLLELAGFGADVRYQDLHDRFECCSAWPQTRLF